MFHIYIYIQMLHIIYNYLDTSVHVKVSVSDLSFHIGKLLFGIHKTELHYVITHAAMLCNRKKLTLFNFLHKSSNSVTGRT